MFIARPREIVRDYDGPDETCRLNFSLNDFSEMEKGTKLDTLFYYWNALRGDGRTLPHVNDFRPAEVFQKELVNWVCGVETTFTDPANFMMREHNHTSFVPHSIRMANKRISEYPSRLHASHCSREYQLCKTLRQPQYHEIDHLSAGVWRRYSRIFLPLTDDTGEVVQLAYGFRLLDTPIRYFDISEPQKI